LVVLSLGCPFSLLTFLLVVLSLGCPFSWLSFLLVVLSLGWPFSWLKQSSSSATPTTQDTGMSVEAAVRSLSHYGNPVTGAHMTFAMPDVEVSLALLFYLSTFLLFYLFYL
jgi:hypothetical protein